MTVRWKQHARSVSAVMLAIWLALPAAPQGREGETGIASWYGYPYHGRHAASGEVYDMEDLTAAHPSLPFNTRVRVVNLRNDQSVEVRITDRGPFVAGRVIDVSRAAARVLGLLEAGTTPVRLEVIGLAETVATAVSGLAKKVEQATPKPVVVRAQAAAAVVRAAARAVVDSVAGAAYVVQTGAFRNVGNAERNAALMRSKYGSARMVAADGDAGLWRVVTGGETTREAADALCERIRRESGEKNAFVVRLDSSHEPRPRGTVAADGFNPPAN